MPTSSFFLLIFAAFAAAGGQLLFKVGAQGRTNYFEFMNLYIMGGLLLYATGTILWIYALSFEKLVNVYAFTALTFVLVMVFGVLVLGEKISISGIFGIILIIGGLFLLTNYNS